MPSFRHCSLFAIAGCAGQTQNQPVAGFHFVGDPATRQRLPPEGTAVQIAFAYNADIRSGGMKSVIHYIEGCYRRMAPADDVVGLRDCMLLDYTAYNIDQLEGRQLNGAPMPYFRDDTLKARLAQYGPTAQFEFSSADARLPERHASADKPAPGPRLEDKLGSLRQNCR